MSAVTFGPVPSSVSTDGEPVLIVATSSTGTTLHTAVSGATQWDSVTIWLSNTQNTISSVTLEWGGTAARHQIEIDLPPKSVVLVAAGWRIRGGKVITAFSDVTNTVQAIINVDRITDNA